MRFHEVLHDVYFDDLDAFAVLHNARYLVLFERTVGSFWRSLGWTNIYDDPDHPDQNQLVRANHIEYLAPVEGTGQLRVRCWIEKLGRTSVVFALQAKAPNEDMVHATGTRVMVRVDPKTRRPTPWSDELREQVKPYRADLDDE